MAALEERKILYRKSNQLKTLMLTQEDIDSFFKSGYLPFKFRSSITTLEDAPNVTATSDLVDLLRTHAREGAVQAMAQLLEPTHSDLTDELLAELAHARGEIPKDEAVVDEMATMVHREYGGSRKLGPVDQRVLKELLTDRTLVRRRASQLQLQRSLQNLKDGRYTSVQRDAEIRRQVVRLADFMRSQDIPQTLGTSIRPETTSSAVSSQNKTNEDEPEEDLTPEKTHRELSTLVEDVFSYIRRTMAQCEHLRDEKRRLFSVLEKSEQRSFLEIEPVYNVVSRVLEKPVRDLQVQNTKLRVVDDRISDLQIQLAKVKRERPVQVEARSDTDQRVQEKLADTQEKVNALEAKERALRAELEDLRAQIADSQQKCGFVARSRTNKLIRRKEREKLRSRLDIASVVQTKMKVESENSVNQSVAALPRYSRPTSRSYRRQVRSRSEGQRTPRHDGHRRSGRSSADTESTGDEDDGYNSSSFGSYRS